MYMHTYMYIYHTYINTYVCVHVSVYIHTYVYTSYIHKYVCVPHTSVCLYIYTQHKYNENIIYLTVSALVGSA